MPHHSRPERLLVQFEEMKTILIRLTVNTKADVLAGPASSRTLLEGNSKYYWYLEGDYSIPLKKKNTLPESEETYNVETARETI